MKTRLFIIAVLLTALYAALGSLWWYPSGAEKPPAEVHLDAIRARVPDDRYDRGLPIVALQRYADLELSLDGRRIETEGPEAAKRRFFSQSLRHKPRPAVDPVVLYGVTASSVDITRIQPEDGPRPGDWTREEHWVRAVWTHPESGARQERAWNASEIIRAFEREVGPGQEPEAVFLEMGPPVRSVEPWHFALAALWLLSGWCALVTGLCEGVSPRRLFGRTLLALILGPLWLIAGTVAAGLRSRPRAAQVAALLVALSAAPAAAQSRPEAVTAYGAYDTLRLKSEGGAGLEARLEIRAGDRWRAVTATHTGPEGWTSFVAPPNQRQLIQYLCDLPLGEARRDESTGGMVRVTVRRAGVEAWLSGSWQGEFIPPPIGVKAWTYWLPSIPPPVQSTAGLVTLLLVLLWVGCIAAVRAEAGGMDLEGAGVLWRHAGWLHLPGALLFFAMHPAPPVAGIGRELAPPRRVEKPRNRVPSLPREETQ